MTACGAIGALMVGGKVVGQLRCDREAGHDIERGPEWLDDLARFAVRSIPATPHRHVLEWTPEHEVDLDLFDPDERFDVVVPT